MNDLYRSLSEDDPYDIQSDNFKTPLKHHQKVMIRAIKDIEKSISYFSKSLKLYSKIKDWKGISKSYLNLGNSNSSKGYTDLAIKCFERGLVIDAKYNNNEKKAEFLSGIGTVYFNLSNNEKALYFYK